MVRGILSSAGAMRPAMMAQSILANNLANTSTPGFRQDRVAFRLGSPVGGAGAAGLQLPEMVTRIDASPGSYEVTERPLDLAIQGEGYFVINTPDGDRYTRSGHFQLSNDGTLVTPQGNPVLSDGGPVVLPPDAQVMITSSGQIRDGAISYGQLQVVTFEEDPGFTHVGEGLLATDAASVTSEEARVVQGVLEGPNVKPVQAMVDMITLLRHFEMNQRALKAQDESLGALFSWARG